MTKEIFMIEEISKEIIILLMEERGLSMKEAFDTLYNSDTYRRLSNTETGLFSQSTPYVYEYLVNEIETGKMA